MKKFFHIYFEERKKRSIRSNKKQKQNTGFESATYETNC